MTIKRKLILLTILPTITILLFSVNHIIDKYRTYDTHEHLIESSKLINNTTNVLHELQLERGFISSYINSKNPEHKNYFKDMLDKQQQKTDKVINEFNLFIQYINSEDIQIINKKFTEKITMLLGSIEDVRTNIANNIITPYESFIHFSYINSQLLELADGIKFYSNDNKTQNNIMALKKLLIFQEASGQERAFIELLIGKEVSLQGLEKLEGIWYIQDNAYQNIKILLDDSVLSNELNKIDNKEANEYIQNTRQKIKEHQNKKFSLNSKVWFMSATERIDDYHKLGRYIFSQILDEITSKNNALYNSFIYQLLFTILTISVLLIGVSLIARNIDESLKKLDNGMNDFFDFLNFKTNAPKDIDTDSNDELSNIAKKTNRQIHYIQNNLDNDKHFIQETTHIVSQMRDGNFSNKLRFNPTNPALMELKVVFNNLIKLISNKIAEQTSSLEALNQSLEEKVYQQTAELEKQIEEVVADKGYHSTDQLELCQWLGLRTYIPEPKSPHKRKLKKLGKKKRQALLNNRKRTKRRKSKELQRKRSERVERSFAHMCDTGGARRTWLHGLDKVQKRFLITAVARNLGLLMRKLFGMGTPRGLQTDGGHFHFLQLARLYLRHHIRLDIDSWRLSITQKTPPRWLRQTVRECTLSTGC